MPLVRVIDRTSWRRFKLVNLLARAPLLVCSMPLRLTSAGKTAPKLSTLPAQDMAIPQGKVRVDHVKWALGLETAPLTWLAIKVSLVSGYSQFSLIFNQAGSSQISNRQLSKSVVFI